MSAPFTTAEMIRWLNGLAMGRGDESVAWTDDDHAMVRAIKARLRNDHNSPAGAAGVREEGR